MGNPHPNYIDVSSTHCFLQTDLREIIVRAHAGNATFYEGSFRCTKYGDVVLDVKLQDDCPFLTDFM
jgi:hypothetical protein